jgi:hypothetical protein
MKSPLDGVLAASYVSPKAVLYGIAVGIAVVGGENSIQRPYRLYTNQNWPDVNFRRK